MQQDHHYVIRLADADDVQELIRLRSYLLVGQDTYYTIKEGDNENEWPKYFSQWFEKHLGESNEHCIYVAASLEKTDRLLGCGIGVIDRRPPAPGILNGKCGWVQSMITVPERRRHGIGSGILLSILSWFKVNEVHRAYLTSTIEGLILYKNTGFIPTGEDCLVHNEICTYHSSVGEKP